MVLLEKKEELYSALSMLASTADDHELALEINLEGEKLKLGDAFVSNAAVELGLLGKHNDAILKASTMSMDSDRSYTVMGNILNGAGKKEEAAHVLKHVQDAIAKFRGRGERREREGGEREGGNANRMEHIAAAIEHLQAAGLRDWAEELAAHAREINKERGHREEGHERRDREEPGHRHEGHEREGNGDLNQMRREVNELRNALREIQKHLEERR